MRFNNRVVIITGGSQGIGEGCARVFCQEGALVVIASLEPEDTQTDGKTLAEDMTKSSPGKAIFKKCDVTVHSEIQEVITQTISEYGKLDCLINNVGWHPPSQTIDETSIEEMENLLKLNYLSSFVATKYAVPHLRNSQGTIVFISSMVAILGQDNAAAYCATKAAQIGLVKALAVELGKDLIRVNAILPSNIDTSMLRNWASSLEQPAIAMQQVANFQVLKRIGTAEEVGKVALFLASDDSSFITGQCIQVEGGASLDY